MSKLPEQYRFIDLSDYGRIIAKWIARALVDSSITPIHITSSFIVSGLLAIVFMLQGHYVVAGFFIILKSILDAADGELARLKKTPSYIGRYYDSIADIILNFLFLLTIWYITNSSIFLMILAFIGMQLQGTLYNYYYVILRNNVSGDRTSRIFEDRPPTAMENEKQKTVNLFYNIYNFLYIAFDKAIYYLDKNAREARTLPKWFMTILSTYGLGFQLLIMSIFLMLDLIQLIIPFFIFYSIFIFVFVGIRKIILK